MPSEWEELRIRLWPVQAGRYFLLANGPASASAVVRIDDPQRFARRWSELQGFEFGEPAPEAETPLEPAEWSQGGGQTAAPPSIRAPLLALGRELFTLLFPGPVCKALVDSQEQAARRGANLRLRFSLPPELTVLPIEVLCSPVGTLSLPENSFGFLARHPGLSIVRSLPGPTPPPGRIPSADDQRQPLHLVAVVSSPDDQPLDAGPEIDALIANRKLTVVDVLSRQQHGRFKTEAVTRTALRARLNALAQKLPRDARGLPAPWALLLIGHGVYDRERKQGFVLLEDSGGRSHRVSGEDLVGCLGGQAAGLRLVILGLCRGGEAAPVEPYSGVAQSLIAAGVPAVVAMRYDVSGAAAGVFSPTVLEALCNDSTIDDAVIAGRNAMSGVNAETEGGGVTQTESEWAIPTCLLGEGCRFTWLFKIRRAVRAGETLPDPLRDGQANLKQYLESGAPLVDDIIEVARFCRTVPNWEGLTDAVGRWQQQSRWEAIEDLCTEALNADPTNDDLQALQNEAQIEQLVERCVVEARLPQVGDFRTRRGIANVFKCLLDETKLKESYDRLRTHENNQQWTEVERLGRSELLLNFADVPVRRRHASARLKERAEDWTGAAAEYRGLPEAVYPSAERRAVYCEARAAEVSQRWEEAGTLYARAGGEFADAPARISYCAGRLAECAERWDDAQAAYARISDASLYPDLPHRRAWMQAWQAEMAGDWQKAASHFEALPDTFPQRAAHLLFVRACQAEAQRRWREALEGFKLLAEQGHPGAARRAERCGLWVNVVTKLELRQWGEATRELDTLLRLMPEDEAYVRSLKRWCQDARVLMQILDRLAAGPLVRDPEVPWPGGSCPYKALEERNVSPSSPLRTAAESTDGVSLAAAQAQARGVLGRIEDRLLVDFTLYTVSDPGRAAGLLRRAGAVSTEGSPLSAEQIVGDLGEDAGIFWSLLRDHERALAFYRERAAARPNDFTVLHHLGLAAAGKIALDRRRGTVDLDDWHTLILAWAPLFVRDDFWEQWAAARRQVYQVDVTAEQVAQARQTLQRFWLEQMQAGAGSQARLDIAWKGEVAGAAAVAGAGGIPLGSGPPAVLGLLGVKAFGLADTVARWSAGLLGDNKSHEGCRPLRRYLSELAEASILLEAERYTEVIAVLSRPRCELLQRADGACAAPQPPKVPALPVSRCSCFRRANPVFADLAGGEDWLWNEARELLEAAYCGLARAALAERPVDLQRTFECWTSAVEMARERGRGHSILDIIREAALGRTVELIKVEGEGRLDALNDAVDLLQRFVDEKWDGGPAGILRSSLVKVLIMRGYHLSMTLDNEQQARENALRAYDLMPPTPDVLQALCRFSTLFAREQNFQRNHDAADWLLAEAERFLQEGERNYPGAAEIVDTRTEFTRAKEAIEDVRRKTVDFPFAEPSGPESRLDRLLAAGVQCHAQKDFEGAVTAFLEILSIDATHAEARAKMAFSYRMWIIALREAGNRPEMVRRLREARDRCGQLEALRDILEFHKHDLE